MPQFRVIGSNRETGARMTLEIAAASKGDAERKAVQSGMNVNHAAPIDTFEELRTPMAKNYRDEAPANNQKKLVIAFVVLLAIFLFTGLVWPGFWK